MNRSTALKSKAAKSVPKAKTAAKPKAAKLTDEEKMQAFEN
jgi:hypothetical protein